MPSQSQRRRRAQAQKRAAKARAKGGAKSSAAEVSMEKIKVTEASAGCLHTGDVLMLHVRSPFPDRPHAYVHGNGVTGDVSLRCAAGPDGLGDVRDLLFRITPQMSYTSMKALRKLKNQPNVSSEQEQTITKKADVEQIDNSGKMNSRIAMSYGEIVQLFHVRSKRFLTSHQKVPGREPSTRHLSLAEVGTNGSWFRLMPFYKYVHQGDLVGFREQLLLQNVKLGPRWHMHWSKDEIGELEKVIEGCSIHEANVSTDQPSDGCGFFTHPFVQGGTNNLPIAAVVRLFHSQQGGFISSSSGASSAVHCKQKRPYVRPLWDSDWYDCEDNICAKSLWTLETSNGLLEASNDDSLVWGSALAIRHFGGSGYLAIDRDADKVNGCFQTCLKQKVDADCLWVLESLTQQAGNLQNVRQLALLRMDMGEGSVWLHCPGVSKASNNQSKLLLCSPKRFVRDAVSVDPMSEDHVFEADSVVGFRDEISTLIKRLHNYGDRWKDEKHQKPTSPEQSEVSPGQVEVSTDSSKVLHGLPKLPDNVGQKDQSSNGGADEEVKSVKAAFLGRKKSSATREEMDDDLLKSVREAVRVRHAEEMEVEYDTYPERGNERRAIFTVLCRVLSSMIFFLSPSNSARPVTDALKAPKVVNRLRQRFVRELKLIDCLFELHDTLRLHKFKVKIKRSRALVENLGPEAVQPKVVLRKAELRSLRLLVRLWMHTFLGSRRNEGYIASKGWMDTINNLNGLGLGAAEVFSALVANNWKLAQDLVSHDTMLKFVDFIRTLGPDDTWLKFLIALCSSQGMAITRKQQEVLTIMFFAGERGSPEAKKLVSDNRGLVLKIRAGDQQGSLELDGLPGVGTCSFLGESLVKNGPHSVLLSWDGDDHWCLTSQSLYFSPETLGIEVVETTTNANGAVEHWVHLHDLMAVLPGGIQASEANSDKRPAQRQACEVLSRFGLAQIQLAADMCKQRQVICIDYLQHELPFNMLLSGLLNDKFPPAAHAGFLRTMQDLWLDRPPHETHHLPARIVDSEVALRVVDAGVLHTEPLCTPMPEQEENGDATVSQFYQMKSSTKFLLLALVVVDMLKSLTSVAYDDVDNIALLGACADALSALLGFGQALGTSSSWLQHCAAAVLRCLDGRIDPISLTPSHAEARSPSKQIGGTPSDVPCGEPAIAIADSPLSPQSSPTRRTLKNIAIAGFPEEEKGLSERYVATEANLIAMQTKAKLGKTYLQLQRIAMHQQVLKVITIFERSNNEKDVKCIQGAAKLICEDPIQGTDKEWAGPRDIDMVFIDLLLHDEANLFDVAVTTLHEKHFAAHYVMQTLQQVFLLRSVEDRELNARITHDALRLSCLLEMHESWGEDDAFSGIDIQKVEECKSLCYSIRIACSADAETDTVTPNPIVQNMLFNLEFAKKLLRAFSIDIAHLSQAGKDILKEILQLVSSLLAMLVHRSHQNQQVLFNNIKLLQPWLNGGYGVANIFSEVFEGNLDMCEQVPESLVFHFVQTLARRERGFQPHQLSFLHSIVVVDDQPVLRNQHILVELFKHPENVKALHLFEESPERLGVLLRAFASWDEFDHPEFLRSWKGEDAELVHFWKSLQLLALLSTGGPESVEGKQTAQSKYRLAKLLTAFNQISEIAKQLQGHASQMAILLKATLVRVVSNAHYNVDRSMQSMTVLSGPEHLHFLDLLLVDMEELVKSCKHDLSKLSKQQHEYLIGMLHTLNHYLEHVLSQPDEEDLPLKYHDELVYVGCQALLCDNGKLKWLLDADDTDDEEVAALCHQLVHWVTERKRKGRKLRAGSGMAVIKEDDKGNQEEVMHEARNHSSPWNATPDRGKDWWSFLKAIALEPCLVSHLANENKMMPDVILNVEARSDPHDHEYMHNLHQMASKPLEEWTFDFRRNRIHVRDILASFATQMRARRSNGSHAPLVVETLTKFVELVSVSLETNGPSCSELTSAGLGRLVLGLMTSKLPDETMRLCLILATKLMEGNEAAPESSSTARASFKDLLRSQEDSNLWLRLADLLKHMALKVKSMGELRQLDETELTHGEKESLRAYSRDLHLTRHALRFMQLLCEGHDREMQNYLFNQADNIKTVNMVGKSLDLCLRMAKKESAADLLNELEAEELLQTMMFLVEVLQGPNRRNQEYISVSGIVEMISKLLRANCRVLLLDSDTPYPPLVRNLKSEGVRLLLAILECRDESKLLSNVILRLDSAIIKVRVVFSHRYFLSMACKAVIPNPGGWPFDDPLAAYNWIETYNSRAVAWLDGLVDKSPFYSSCDEVLALMQLIRQLGKADNNFHEELRPHVPHFIDDPDEHSNEIARDRARVKYFNAKIYAEAFAFFDRLLCNIEIVVEGHLVEVIFVKPFICDFVLGATKRRILEEVPFDSPDEKLKGFFKGCKGALAETSHAQHLQMWALGMFRPFHWALKHDNVNLDRGMRFCLLIALVQSICVLVGVENTVEDPSTTWSNDEVGLVVMILMIIYVLVMFHQLIVVIALYVPLHGLKAIVTQGQVVRRLFLMAFAIPSLVHEPIWVVFLLLDFMIQDPSLLLVAEAVIVPGKALGMLVILFFIFVVIYATVAFRFLKASHRNFCDTVVNCFFNYLHQGGDSALALALTGKHSTKPGNDNDDTFAIQLLFDTSWFVLVTNVLLGAVLGLIVDGFSTLKESKEKHRENLRTEAFISCIERRLLDEKAHDGFEINEKLLQSKWNYLAFYFLLRLKNEDDYTGPETACRKLLDANVLSFLPIGKSSLLQSAESEEDKDTGDDGADAADDAGDGNDASALRRSVKEILSRLEEQGEAMTDLRAILDRFRIDADDEPGPPAVPPLSWM